MKKLKYQILVDLILDQNLEGTLNKKIMLKEQKKFNSEYKPSVRITKIFVKKNK